MKSLKDFTLSLSQRRGRSFVVSVFLFFICFVCWTFSTPMFGVADEPAHIVRSAGISHGDFSGTAQTKGDPLFQAPNILRTDVCFAFNFDIDASCLKFVEPAEDILISSTAATYPPLSHMIFSIPVNFLGGLGSLYAMRILGAFVCAVFFAIGLDSLRSIGQKPALSVGVALGLTPMVLSLCGSVNPSGMAIASAFATWTGGLSLLQHDRPEVGATRLLSFFGPLSFYLVIRRDSLIWGIAILACLVVLSNWSTLRQLSRHWLTWFFSILLVGETALQAFVWGGPSGQGLTQESGPLIGSTNSGNSKAAFGTLPSYFKEAIGVLGWKDAAMPEFVYLFWGSLIIGLICLAFSGATIRFQLSLLLALLFFVLIPVKIGAVQFPYLQGRYTLPLLIGAPILAVSSLRVGKNSLLGDRASARTICILIWFLGVVSFLQSARRFTVGLSSPWSALKNPRWNPPFFSTHFLLFVYPFVLAILIFWLLALFTRKPIVVS